MESALETVYNKLLGEDPILVKMRRGDGLDEEEWKALKQAIHVLISYYKGKEMVPKKLALAFLDVSNYFYFREDVYSEEEQDRLEDAAHEIVQMADELFSN